MQNHVMVDEAEAYRSLCRKLDPKNFPLMKKDMAEFILYVLGQKGPIEALTVLPGGFIVVQRGGKTEPIVSREETLGEKDYLMQTHVSSYALTMRFLQGMAHLTREEGSVLKCLLKGRVG